MTDEQPLCCRVVADVSISAEVRFLPAVLALVRSAAAELGLAEAVLPGLELAVEESFVNAVEHAFAPGEQGRIRVTVERRPGQVVVGVEDRGLPFDLARAQKGDQAGLGVILMKAYADEVRFLNLGKQGKRVELVKDLVFDDVCAYLPEGAAPGSPETDAAPLDTPLTVRLMRPEEAAELSRCVYRSYGYSYAGEHLYFPEKVKELLAGGLMHSCVASAPDGEIAAHLALCVVEPNARVGETGQAVVDPRFRGRGLFKQTKTFVSEFARRKGMLGVFSESVTIHPYTQKGNLSLGARETGFLLGSIPQSMKFKAIHDQEQPQRQTALLFYLRVNQEPERIVYAPERHEAMIRRICERNGLRRTVAGAGVETAPPASARLDVTVRPEWGQAFLRVTEVGRDLGELVEVHLNELRLRKIDCIYLDLPLSQPGTRVLCGDVETLGFFFAGVIPELAADGDVLRLQHLNNVRVEPDEIRVGSDFAGDLLDYILTSSEVRSGGQGT